MNRLLIVAATLAISTAPLHAERQQPDAAKLKADARNVVGIIGGGKAKTRRSNSAPNFVRWLIALFA
jgi:hypothetical protein